MLRNKYAVGAFKLGESVVVTGHVSDTGKSGLIIGLYREEGAEGATLYVVRLESASVLHLPEGNLQRRSKTASGSNMTSGA